MNESRSMRCPECGRQDLERVRAVVKSETTRGSGTDSSTTLASNLQQPWEPGEDFYGLSCGTVAAVIFAILWTIFSFVKESGANSDSYCHWAGYYSVCSVAHSQGRVPRQACGIEICRTMGHAILLSSGQCRYIVA